MASAYIDEANPTYRFWDMSDIMIDEWSDKEKIGGELRLTHALARLIVAIHRSVKVGQFQNAEAHVEVADGWADVKLMKPKEDSVMSYRFPIQGVANIFDDFPRYNDDPDEIVREIIAVIDRDRGWERVKI